MCLCSFDSLITIAIAMGRWRPTRMHEKRRGASQAFQDLELSRVLPTNMLRFLPVPLLSVLSTETGERKTAKYRKPRSFRPPLQCRSPPPPHFPTIDTEFHPRGHQCFAKEKNRCPAVLLYSNVAPG